MERKNELKHIHIKNRTCYYFHEIMRDIEIYSGDMLVHEKSHKTYENINL